MKETNFENISLSENEQENTFDFKAEFYKVLGHWKFFVIFTLACFIIAFLYIRYTSPVYKIRCSVLIKDDSKTKLGQDNILNQLDVFNQQSNVQNEIGIIHSKSLSRKTVSEQNLFIYYYYFTNKLKRKLEIYDECPYRVIVDTTHVQLINTPIQIKFDSKGNAHIKINDYDKATPYYFSKIKNTSPSSLSNVPVDATLKLNEQFTNASFSFKLVKNQCYYDTIDIDKNYCFEIHDPLLVGEDYSGLIKTERIDKDASIIEVTLNSTLPSKSEKFLRALSENYINIDLEYKNLTAINTIKFIDNQLEQITDSLHNVEDILEHFRTKNKTIDLPIEYQAIITKLGEQDDERVKTNIEIKYYEYILDYLQKNKDYLDIISPSFMGITDGTLNTLVTELVTLAQEKNKLKISSTENNPYFTTIETNIATTKKALVDQIKNSLGLAQISQKDINKRISESEAMVNKLPGTEKDLFTIQRKFNLSDQTYSFLLEKRAEASISKASNLSNNMILDPAEIGEKVHPKTHIIYLIALLLGILLPYIVIRLREYFNDTIQSKNDIESQSNLTIIGTIAHSKYQTSLVVIDKPRSMVSETIRSVKANMDFVGAKGSNIISLTSTIGGEGKTYCSINLSSSFAISDKKTVLIGADLRKPKIFNDFNLTNDKGLTSYLIGKCDLDDIINETQVKNLHIITAGPIPPNPAELLSSEKMKELLQELRKIYDYIIIDTPPLGIVTDALFLMRHSDINIYVTRFNYTSKKVIKDVNDMVKTTGVKNVCFLLNDIMFNEGRYGKYGQYSNKYGYTYTYHKGYYEED